MNQFQTMRSSGRASSLWTTILAVLGLATTCLHASVSGAAEIGVNDFYLARQYLGTADQGDGSDRYRRVEVAMARKALRDAQINGSSFVRLAASGFTPSAPGQIGDLDLWRTDPRTFWARIDEMMDALDRYGQRGVFSFIWNVLQFPAMTGDTVRDMITNPTSKSYGLAAKYVNEFVTRYRGRRTVMLYELTNELNLTADLDSLGACKKSQNAAVCAVQGNFSTDEMIAFCQRLAVVIRNADPNRQITSGFSLPRRAAEHLRAHPQWSSNGADFTPDSMDQLQKNLRDIHSMVDVIEVHIYADPGGENTRLGVTDPRNAQTFETVVRITRKIGKPLYVGEYGDSERGDADDTSFLMRMMDKISELKPAYNSPWVWEFYQSSTYRTRDTDASKYSMEPGFTDHQLGRFRQLARSLGESIPGMTEIAKVPPHVVLTWPLDCSLLGQSQLVHAVASDDAGRGISVKFLLDDQQVGQKDAAPYEFQMRPMGIRPGTHTLKAVAVDSAGLQDSYATPVVVGTVTAGGACARAFPAG